MSEAWRRPTWERAVTELLQDIVDALSLGSIYALVALGIALIFGIMRLINFAHGELIMIAGYTMLLLNGAPWPLVILAAIAAGVIAALLMERVAFRPIRGASPATLMITSFAVSFLLQNVAILVFTSRTRAVDVSISISESTDILGLRVAWIDMVTSAVSILLLVALALFLKRHPAGRQMRAAAEHFTMARLLGIRANRVIALAFGISGALAAVAALLLIAKSGTVSPTIGQPLLLVGVVATVVGGMGSLPGAVLGGYLLGALTVTLQTTLPTELTPYRDAFLFSVVIAILVLKPGGILGRGEDLRV